MMLLTLAHKVAYGWRVMVNLMIALEKELLMFQIILRLGQVSEEIHFS
jgi:hypothetical protein